MPHDLTPEVRYRLLKFIDDNPHASQRDVARALGVSLGKANYCLKALVEKGLVKIGNFRRSRNKAGYAYLLTRKGLEERARVTRIFLQIKVREYDALVEQIRDLKGEVEGLASPAGAVEERA